MKSPLGIGVVRAPKINVATLARRPEAGKAKRIAGLSAAAAVVLGVGTASAFFVDYLADRALARAAEAPVAVKPVAVKPVVVKPVVAKAVGASAGTKVAALAFAPAPASSQPVKPPKTEIAAATPDPAALAKVAVGPEHAIELPTDDPTASPVVHVEEIAASGGIASVDESVVNEEPLTADDDADATQTAAIAAARPAIAAEPAKKPKRQAAEQAKPQPKETELASLPGVDVGGLTGQPGDGGSAASTVQSVARQTKTLGGMAPGAARVTASVKLRSGPQKGAGVLGVVPSGSAVNVLSCDGWCQVSYNGRKGWVYKNYLSAAPSAKPQEAASGEAAAPSATTPAAPAERKTISSRL
ncbi:MAG TPA: SH3 domain-containing protein [Rhizobiaceae bacterium]